MGRSSDARERLVDAAFRLWFRRSYADVGVSEICEAAGVQKGSFYHFFPSKTDLAVAVVDEVAGRFDAEIVGPYLADRTRPPLERLERLIDHHYDFALSNKEETGHVWGCPIGNLSVELSTQDDVLRARLSVFFARWAGAFTTLLDEAVAAGELPPHDTVAAGTVLLAYLQGMTVLAKAGNDPGVFRTIGPTIAAIATAQAAAPAAA
jgi:TetR/AcrR family transcriptional regulator, transcriptional repressor for nem operon